MSTASSQDPEKIRQQYDSLPYPHAPIEKDPRDAARSLNTFFLHSLVTAYYLRDQRVIDPKGKVILDAGCGSGYKALYLAIANPGAKIVGVDLSPESVRWAQQRFKHHGFDNSEFHVASIEEIPSLGLEFDYINCDEVLYLLPDPAAGLAAMKAALKPSGILRTNLHSLLQRERFFRAQELFGMMGLMDDNPGDLEISVVQETMAALKDKINLKATAWGNQYRQQDSAPAILMNHLLQGDRGYTIPQMFEMLAASGLHFISMVMWRNWELTSLFKDADDLPALWAMSLPTLPVAQQLRIYELLHPLNRLLDFWCTPASPANETIAPAAWSPADWQRATVTLHPLLQTDEIRQQVEDRIRSGKPFNFQSHIAATTFGPVNVDSRAMAVLLPLWSGSMPVSELAQRFQQLYPKDPLSLAPVTPQAAFTFVTNWITKLEVFLYLLVEAPR